MRHRKRCILEGSWFDFNSITNPKTGRKHYEIRVNCYMISSREGWIPADILKVKAHFDPAGNRGSRQGTKWKYSNKRDAEQLITLALLKWGS